jgi:argininosuccinate synthase
LRLNTQKRCDNSQRFFYFHLANYHVTPAAPSTQFTTGCYRTPQLRRRQRTLSDHYWFPLTRLRFTDRFCLFDFFRRLLLCGSRENACRARRTTMGDLLMASCVLAYSGGLDTSVILGWLQDQGYAVHAVYVDLGQPCEDRQAVLEKARQCGAATARIIDAREELCRDFAFPVLQWQAKYEGMYLLGTSIARPLISKACLQVARETGADAYAHGATGKGNDQCRFQLAAEALDADVKVIAPWRNQQFRSAFPGRTEMIEYCQQRKISVKASVAKPYSSDENCLHISYEAGDLEMLDACGIDIVDFGMTVSLADAPDDPETVTIQFEKGIPVAINNQQLSPLGIVEAANRIAGAHGIGRIDVVENRFVGMKSRGVYEAPGMTMLYEAHRYIEQLTMDRDLMHLRDQLAPIVAERVYYGYWYTPQMDALFAFNRQSQSGVTGEVVLRLYKGNIVVLSRSSQFSLYDEGIATMEGGGSYNQSDAEGFLKIQGLPSRVQARITPRKY